MVNQADAGSQGGGGAVASYPIEHWEGAEKYITDALTEVKTKCDELKQHDMDDLMDANIIRKVARGMSHIRAREFDENAPQWTKQQILLVENFETATRHYIEDLGTYLDKCWDELVKVWENNYKNQIRSPKTLWDKAELWKDIRAKEMDHLNTDVGQMQLQTSWTGKGAEAYGKSIEVQNQAFTKITELVDASSGALNNGSSGLQRLYLSVAQCAMQMKSEMESAKSPSSEDFGYYTRVGITVVKACKEYLETDLKEGLTTWGEQIDDGSRKLKDAVADERPFTGQEWPKVEGDLSDMEPGPSTGAGTTPPPEAPPTTPAPDADSEAPVTPDGYEATDPTKSQM